VSVSAAARGPRAKARDSETRSLRFFEAGVVLLDLGILVTGAWLGGLKEESLVDVVAWVLLISAAGLIPVPSDRGVYLGLELPLVLGVGFVFGPAMAGLVALLGVLDIRELRREVPLGRALFNRAQVSLSALAGSWAFHAVGGDLASIGTAVLPGIAAILLDAAVNYSLVAWYWRIKSHRSILDIVGDMRLGSAKTFAVAYLLFGFMSVLVGAAYVGWGIAGVLAFTVPVALARQAFHHRHLLERADRRIEVKDEALRDVENQILRERRDERLVLAGELHDEVLPPLFKVHLMGQVLRQDLSTGRLLDLDEDLPELLSATEVAQAAIRELVSDLRRSHIGPGGLLETIRLVAAQLESAGSPPIALELSSVDASKLTQLLVYQVMREALTNAARHSQATTISARLWQDEGLLRLRVEDDGTGFDQTSVDRGHHFGLQLIHERIEAARGTVVVDSQLGQGTSVTAVLPPDA
jgi:signal transduction histidine kinase